MADVTSGTGRAAAQLDAESVFLGGGGADQRARQSLLLRYANRHGLIAGATGTGKTVTLQIMAEGFSAAGSPVFLADVKGDLSGLAAPGSPSHKLHDALMRRAHKIGFDSYAYGAPPVVFWDVFGEQGHPIRARISDLGPIVLSRLLDLNEVQEGVLNVVFRVAEDDGLPLIDLKDLRAMLAEVAENASQFTATYGSVSRASVGAIQRRLLVLENQGADVFFGEPAVELSDLLRTDAEGRGVINILAADRLMQSPRMYATVLFWLLQKLFRTLPEVGDPPKPTLAFFFDEAHLLFDDAPKALVDQVEQVARLIRSKGVGVFFVTQSPTDVPDDVLGQLGARVQHALRAFTPKDQKALRAAAETFRANDAFDTAEVLPELGVGEALVSTLGPDGAPSVVERTLIRPPSAQIGPISTAERAAVREASVMSAKYDAAVDLHSAYEALGERRKEAARKAAEVLAEAERGSDSGTVAEPMSSSEADEPRSRGDSVAERGANAFWRSLVSKVGRRLATVVVDSVMGRRRR